MSRPKIDWELYNAIADVIRTSTIMLGEEKQLSDEEIDNFNRALKSVKDNVSIIEDISSQAKERYRYR